MKVLRVWFALVCCRSCHLLHSIWHKAVQHSLSFSFDGFMCANIGHLHTVHHKLRAESFGASLYRPHLVNALASHIASMHIQQGGRVDLDKTLLYFR